MNQHLLALACVLALTGCATTSTRNGKVSAPCDSAKNLPAEPERPSDVDPSQPGEVVRAAIINRKKWASYADELKTRLRACK